ncbi:hypothetical protein PUN28_001843 [Cardiocondyla obscurior]|uniref:Uncharacterized protein n=1 Tax=Cardiocondyla obscurior TaxID=286306 RepID=A0AAW2GRM0_9HYME
MTPNGRVPLRFFRSGLQSSLIDHTESARVFRLCLHNEHTCSVPALAVFAVNNIRRERKHYQYCFLHSKSESFFFFRRTRAGNSAFVIIPRVGSTRGRVRKWRCPPAAAVCRYQ